MPPSEEKKSSYENVRGGKLSFKGGLDPKKKIDKKKKKKKTENEEGSTGGADGHVLCQMVDTGIGFAPDGKKSKNYEELFPVEAKKLGLTGQDVPSREDALDERVKKKADRYCK
eukprot:c22186_g1_i1 orf=251-592(+)